MRTSAYTDVVPNQKSQRQKPVNVSDGFAETKTYAQGRLKAVPEPPSESDDSSYVDPQEHITSKVNRRKINLNKPVSQH